MRQLLKTKLTSRKLWMTIVGAAMLYLAYRHQVSDLHDLSKLDAEKLAVLTTAYSGIARDFMVAFAAVVFSYLGVHGAIQWRHGTGAAVQQVAQTILNKTEVDERLVQEFAEKYKDDPSYRPVEPDNEEVFR